MSLLSDSSLTSLRLQLARQYDTLSRLFKEWDPTNVGIVTRRDFHRAIAQLNLDVGKATVDALFSYIDTENTNYIEYESLKKMISSPEPSSRTSVSPSVSPPKVLPLMMQGVAVAQTELTYVSLAVLEAEREDWRLRALAAEQRAVRLDDEATAMRARVTIAEEDATRSHAAAQAAQDELRRAQTHAMTADEEAARTRAHEAACVAQASDAVNELASAREASALEVARARDAETVAHQDVTEALALLDAEREQMDEARVVVAEALRAKEGAEAACRDALARARDAEAAEAAENSRHRATTKRCEEQVASLAAQMREAVGGMARAMASQHAAEEQVENARRSEREARDAEVSSRHRENETNERSARSAAADATAVAEATGMRDAAIAEARAEVARARARETDALRESESLREQLETAQKRAAAKAQHDAGALGRMRVDAEEAADEVGKHREELLRAQRELETLHAAHAESRRACAEARRAEAAAESRLESRARADAEEVLEASSLRDAAREEAARARRAENEARAETERVRADAQATVASARRRFEEDLKTMSTRIPRALSPRVCTPGRGLVDCSPDAA